MQALTTADLVAAFTDELRLCRLTRDEHLVILAEPTSRQDYIGAAFAAGKALGAHVLVVTAPGGGPTPVPPTHTGAGSGLESVLTDDLAIGTLTGADLVVDLTREGFIHAPVQQTILAAGTRILFVCDPPEVLVRNMPTPADKVRVTDAVGKIGSSTSMHVTSVAGTDLVVDISNSHPGFQTGFADDPGRWDHWPSTMAMCWPEISNGQIVLAPGDIVLPFKDYVVDETVLTIVNGYIDTIAGGFTAQMLRQYFADTEDKWGRYLSHMGWGLMHSADWFAHALYAKHELMGMDARAFAGNFLWSTGPHPFLDRDSYAHLDIAMRNCTVSLDGVAVVEAGTLVG